MVRIAWISPSPLLPTGLGKVTKYITRGLYESGYEVYIGNLQHAGHPINIDGIINYPLYDDRLLPDFLDEVKPDLVIAYGSIWVSPFNLLGQICSKKNIKLMFYATIEFSSLSIYFIKPLIGANYLATPSKFGKKVLMKYNISGDRIKVVPHGVNMKIFRPFKSSFEGYEDMFFYGMVARNTPRKEFPVIIKAFRMLPDEVKENSMLYFHTSAEEEGTTMHGAIRGWDIPLLVTKYGLQGKVLLPGRAHKYWGVSEEELAQIYNALNVYVHASTGEGFGLPLIEAMACGKPIIASKNTAIPEVVGDAGILVPCWEEDLETTDGFTIATTKIKEFSGAMLKLYEDDKFRNELSRRALKRVKLFTWVKAVNLMVEAIEEALNINDRIGHEVLRASEPICAEGNPGELIKYVDGGGKVLDLGSGKLCLAEKPLLNSGFNEYYSLDIRFSKKLTVVADARNLPFRDKSFDYIWSNQLLEHIPTQDQIKVVTEAMRVGKHGIFIFPSEKTEFYHFDPDHKPLNKEIREKSKIIEDGKYYMIRW